MNQILPHSINDIFPWKIYDYLPKSSDGNEIFFFGANPLKMKTYSSWHLQTQTIYQHTYQ